jgi:hypothetical protein
MLPPDLTRQSPRNRDGYWFSFNDDFILCFLFLPSLESNLRDHYLCQSQFQETAPENLRFAGFLDSPDNPTSTQYLEIENSREWLTLLFATAGFNDLTATHSQLPRLQGFFAPGRYGAIRSFVSGLLSGEESMPSPSCLRGAGDFETLISGGVAPLNHRLQARIPPGWWGP